GSPRDLPVPAERAWVRARVSDHAGTGRALAFLPLPILPSTKSTASALRICAFRGSMAGPHLPLSTLRRAPHGTLRMTRGQCGSLYLSLCKTFTHYSLPVSRRTEDCTQSDCGASRPIPIGHPVGEILWTTHGALLRRIAFGTQSCFDRAVYHQECEVTWLGRFASGS